jgi:hypothetical protein
MEEIREYANQIEHVNENQTNSTEECLMSSLH